MKFTLESKLLILFLVFMAQNLSSMNPAAPSLDNLPKEMNVLFALKLGDVKPSQAFIKKLEDATLYASDKDAAEILLEFAKDIGNVLQAIKSLGKVNKRFYHIVNNHGSTNYFIRTLARKWGQSLLPIAISLGTPGSKVWIEKYIKTTEGLKEAKDLLFLSARNGMEYAPFIYALKQVGIDINSVDENNENLLFYAIRNKLDDVIKLLFDTNINVNHRNNNNYAKQYMDKKCISYTINCCHQNRLKPTYEWHICKETII